MAVLAALSASTIHAFGLAGPKKLIKSILVSPRSVVTDQVRRRINSGPGLGVYVEWIHAMTNRLVYSNGMSCCFLPLILYIFIVQTRRTYFGRRRHSIW
jgi:hypothetical protein